MALRINTNVAALNAHKNLVKNDNSLSSSLEKLSSGLRINRAADDASGMAIADSLRSQSLGLGQAIRNGNDAISIVQTADAALEESINIVNTIKTKSIQAAQDGQTTDSRKAIQSDITKLMEELDNIAKTTSFNNQKLLSGNFTDKEFQIGAYSGETIGVSIQSTEANKIGHIRTSDLHLDGPGAVNLAISSNLTNATYNLASIELKYNNSAENGVGAVADAINKLSDKLGISAAASVQSSTDSNIAAGTTGSSFAINGVTIGALDVQENDADAALVNAINNKTSEHGVVASVDSSGVLTLNSSDNRAIEVIMNSATKAVMGGTEKLSTFGIITVNQMGSAEIQISDTNDSTGAAVSTIQGGITVSGAAATEIDSIAAAGSILGAGTQLGSGTVVQGIMITSGDSTTSGGVIGAGSILTTGSIISCGAVLTGSMTVSGTATQAVGSLVTAGSILTAGTDLNSGTVFAGDVSASLSGDGGVGVHVSGSFTVVSGAATITSDLTLTGNATLGSGVTIELNSVLKAGSQIYGALGITANSKLNADMTLKNGAESTIASGSTIKTGSYLKTGELNLSTGTVTQDMVLKTDTVVGTDSFLADGSSIGGNTYGLTKDVTVSSAMSLGSGSVINSGSIIARGTLLSTDITDDNGTTYMAGTVLENDITTETGATTTLTGDMTLAEGSLLKAGSQLEINGNNKASTAPLSLTDGEVYRLSDVDVTTQEGAQIAMAVADAALKTLDKVRSDLGSVQNQLTSTISNISTTKVNVEAAESTIRDVDFAAESSNFTKMQILSQAGTFAMSQANASSQNVLSLLQ